MERVESNAREALDFQTLSNLLAALREGDYSIRARGARGGSLEEVITELNALGTTLREQRLDALEAGAPEPHEPRRRARARAASLEACGRLLMDFVSWLDAPRPGEYIEVAAGAKITVG